MICYYTHLNVNDDFNQEILLEMFFSWLNNTKNRMPGLSFDHIPFYYQIDNKKLIIDEFQDHQIMAIKFKTHDNYKNNQFIVEIIYSYMTQSIDLNFYKEIKDDSKYISAISIPKIFKDIILSSYIRLDEILQIQDKPHFFNYREFKSMNKDHFHLPLIILTRTNRCCIDPFILSQKVLGIAHVICIHSHVMKESVDIIYPDGYQECLMVESKKSLFIDQLSEKLRNYMIQENNQCYSFDELMRLRLQNEHDQNIQASKEFQQYFENEINNTKIQLEQIKEEFKQLEQELKESEELSQRLEQEMSKYLQESILVTSDLKLKDNYERFIKDIIQQTINNLAKTEKYRKRDVLESIIRSNI